MKKEKLKNASWEIIKLLLSSTLGFLFAYITFSKQYNATEKARLNDNLNKILDVNLQYPFVDDSAFIVKWNLNKYSNTDSSLRYQTYCEYVFDFLQNVCEYYKYDKKEIENFIDINDLIFQQKGWWDMPEQKNSQAYPEKFKKFINSYFK